MGKVLAADDLGRLFTTPEQRSTLEKLRHQKPVQEITIPEIVLEGPEIEEEKPEIGGITVKGLVYRENGKSTAWVNSGNTYEGNLSNQYIQVDAKGINPDEVEIEIPLNETRVRLKSGETYNPESDEVKDIKYR